MKRKSGFVLKRVGDDNLLIPIDSKVLPLNGILILSATAVYMWELLVEEHSFDSLCHAVTQKFSVSYEIASDDIKVFLHEISNLGLLES